MAIHLPLRHPEVRAAKPFTTRLASNGNATLACDCLTFPVFVCLLLEMIAMKIYGPIVLIDDDKDDLEIMEEVLVRLGISAESIRTFTDCFTALKYLETTPERPFLIMCDVNIPAMNGMEFRRIINQNEYLRRKSVPFIFFSSATIGIQVTEAYEMTVQGFFLKRNSLEETEQILKRILEYWIYCVHPNSN